MSRAKVQGISQRGGTVLITSGITSDAVPKTINSYPLSLITVFLAGTLTPAVIFSDDSGTILANPFSSASDASFAFWVGPGIYDLRFSGGSIPTNFTLSGIVVPEVDPSTFVDVNYASLSAAVTAIGSTPGTLRITQSAFPNGANCTVPSTLVLEFVGDGYLTIATGQTVIIQSDGSQWPIRKIFYNATAGLGTISFSGDISLGNIYPQWWGAVGDDFTDCTASITAMLHLAEYNGSLTGARFVFPSGTYRHTGLTYRGGFTSSFFLHGEAAGAGFNGAVLKYTGTTGGTAVQLLGANYCHISDIGIDGGASGGVGGALVGLSVDYDTSRSLSSFNCTFDRVIVSGVNGVNSKGIAVGLLSSTSAEHEFSDCNVVGHFTAGTTYYGFWIGNSNTKDIRISRGGVNSCRWGVSAGNSGYLVATGMSFASNTQGDFFGSGSNVSIIGGGSEGSGRFIDSALSPTVTGQFSVVGFYWAGNCVSSDDYIVKWSGAFTSINSQYGNGRTGTSIPKFRLDPIATTGGGGIVSLNNTYQDNGSSLTVLPFYNSSNQLFSALAGARLGLTSRGDRVSLVSTGGATSLLPVIDPDLNLGTTIHAVTATGATDALTEDTVITIDATLGNNYINLQTASLFGATKRFLIVRIDNSANLAQVFCSGSNINGSDTYTLVAQYDFVEITSNGTQWYITGRGSFTKLVVTGLLIQGEGTALTVGSNTITPTNSVHQINAAGGLIKTIAVPSGFTSGTIYLIAGATPPTADTSGNIGRAVSTWATGQMVAFTYSSTTSKWYPSL